MKKYRNPTPTVDIIIETPGGIVLIKRKNPPLGWALPGGFVDEGETVEAAAKREAKEETGLTVRDLEQFHVYSDPKRDPRQHTISIVFTARSLKKPKAGDDAAWVEVFPYHKMPCELAFDHATILGDYFKAKDGRK